MAFVFELFLDLVSKIPVLGIFARFGHFYFLKVKPVFTFKHLVLTFLIWQMPT
jgi:hypothetical protein